MFRVRGTDKRWCIQNGCLRKCIKRQACLAVRLQDKVKQDLLRPKTLQAKIKSRSPDLFMGVPAATTSRSVVT